MSFEKYPLVLLILVLIFAGWSGFSPQDTLYGCLVSIPCDNFTHSSTYKFPPPTYVIP